MDIPQDGRRAAGVATRQRLLDAATELVVTSGLDALTIRAVSDVARTNVASVSYHFGSRDALVAAVVQALSAPIVQEQHDALAKLEASDGPTSVADWVAAWGRPLLRMAASSSPGASRLGHLIGQAVSSPGSRLDAAVQDVVVETDERLVQGLLSAQPKTPEADIRLRLAVMVSVVAGLASGAFATHLARAGPRADLEPQLLAILTTIAIG